MCLCVCVCIYPAPVKRDPKEWKAPDGEQLTSERVYIHGLI